MCSTKILFFCKNFKAKNYLKNTRKNSGRSEKILTEFLNKSVSWAISHRVMNKNRKFSREISKKKNCDEIIISLLSTNITPSG